MATIKRIGFGQVQPNHLSAQHNGQIYAQLPCEEGVFEDEMLENGQFVKYDYANGVVNLSGSGEWLLVMNEIKLYDERKQGYKNFVYRAADFTDNRILASWTTDLNRNFFIYILLKCFFSARKVIKKFSYL